MFFCGRRTLKCTWVTQFSYFLICKDGKFSSLRFLWQYSDHLENPVNLSAAVEMCHSRLELIKLFQNSLSQNQCGKKVKMSILRRLSIWSRVLPLANLTSRNRIKNGVMKFSIMSLQLQQKGTVAGIWQHLMWHQTTWKEGKQFCSDRIFVVLGIHDLNKIFEESQDVTETLSASVQYDRQFEVVILELKSTKVQR